MSTLTTPPVSTLLERLWQEAERSMQVFRKRREALRTQGLGHDSPEFAAIAREAYLSIAPETGKLLYMLVRTRRPKLIVEFGMSFGISTIHLAAGLRDNGEGRLITTEREPNKIAAARAAFEEAGLSDLVDIREGDALRTLAQNLPGPVDLLLLDGANHLYLDVLNLLEKDLAPVALVVADNAETPGYRTYVRSQPRFVSTAIDSRVELTLLASPDGRRGGLDPG